uniref:HTH_Tnp_Tc3_1 domain-containing protein n=1 Tax=Caenorhabditis japonica TaxID=281687 RepID=A0A8R1IV22_CAEJA
MSYMHSLSSIITGLASTLSSEEQAQLEIMIQLEFSILEMSRRITRSRYCVRNYARDTMAHGSAKPTGRPRILNDRDKRSASLLDPIENVWGLLARAVYRHGKQFQTVGEIKDAVTEEYDKLQSSYLESLTESMSNRLCQVMQKFVGPSSY